MKRSNRLIGAMLAGTMMSAIGTPAIAMPGTETGRQPEEVGAGKEADQGEAADGGAEGIVVTGTIQIIPSFRSNRFLADTLTGAVTGSAASSLLFATARQSSFLRSRT